jgi:hypothetical protein
MASASYNMQAIPRPTRDGSPKQAKQTLLINKASNENKLYISECLPRAICSRAHKRCTPCHLRCFGAIKCWPCIHNWHNADQCVLIHCRQPTADDFIAFSQFTCTAKFHSLGYTCKRSNEITITRFIRIRNGIHKMFAPLTCVCTYVKRMSMS